MPTPTPTSRLEPLALLEAAHSTLVTLVQQVTDDRLDAATPCDGWAVRDLLAHLIGVAGGVETLARTGELRVDPVPADVDGLVADAVERLTWSTAAVRSALCGEARDEDAGKGTAPSAAEDAAAAGAVEYATHGWDLATALGVGSPLADVVAEQILDLVRVQVTDDGRGEHFGPVATTPADAAAVDRLAGYLGRTVA